MQSAYTECNDWLNEIRFYIEDNAKFACEYIKDHIPTLSVMKPEGSFLLWIDCSALNLSQDERTKLLEEKGKIIVEPGEKYGLGGEEHIRINIGCPRSVLEEILNRLRHTFSINSFISFVGKSIYFKNRSYILSYDRYIPIITDIIVLQKATIHGSFYFSSYPTLFTMTPQAIRSPDLPVGCVIPSSAFSVIIIDAPSFL